MVNQTTTDNNGTCTIEGVEKGSLTVTVSKTGYKTTTETINVTGNSNLNIVLDEEEVTRNISFTINDGENPIGGASVTIGNVTSTTGSAGGCTLQNISDGSQTVNVTAVGCEDYEDTITVSEENTVFTFSLTRIIYDFTSYNDENKTKVYATGTAQQTGTVSGNYSEIEVLTNTIDGFVGEKYYILTSAETDGETPYQLYSDAGTTGTGVYVTISVHE